MSPRPAALLCLLVLAPLAHAQAAIDWAPEAPTFSLAIPEVGWSMDIAEADLDSLNAVNLPLEENGVRYSIALISTSDTLRLAPEAAGVYRVHLRGLSREASFDFNFWPSEEVHFSEAFRNAYGGTSRILTPEVYAAPQRRIRAHALGPRHDQRPRLAPG